MTLSQIGAVGYDCQYQRLLFSLRSPAKTEIGIFNGRKEGNVLFNDALNTFYFTVICVGHMVTDHSDSKRGNPLPPLNGKRKNFFI